MRYIISEACDGMLLRTYLCDVIRLSRRHLTRLKQTENGILLNQRTVRAVLHCGDELLLNVEEESKGNIVPRGDMPPILYEDDALLICNKSGLMPTHPSHGHFDDTLANAVAAYDLSATGHIRTFRPITRLDRETSGIVLIARTQLAATRLSEHMRQRRMQKTYLAILDGTPSPRQGCVKTAIRRAEDSIILREVCDEEAEGAQRALTHYCVLAEWPHEGGTRSLVKATPITGRTHQLRLHFAHLGTPIVGDGLYGHTPTADTPRQCLHARSLAFTHPLTDEPMTVCAPLYEDMSALIPSDVRAALADVPTSDTSKPYRKGE